MSTTRKSTPASRTAGIREAKARLSELLRDVEHGREWIIADRGRPVARLVPISKEGRPLAERLRDLERAGVIEKAARPSYRLPPPLPLAMGAAQRLLDDERGA